MSRSSANPEALIGYAASMHTESQAVIDHLGGAGVTEKLDAVRTRCSEYVRGEIPDVAGQARVATLGAQELDMWTAAVGRGFLWADTSGTAVVQVDDDAVIANLPPGLADPPAETRGKIAEGQRLFNDLMAATEDRNHDRIEEILAILEERQGDTALLTGFAMKVEELGGMEELQERIEDGMRPKNREGVFGGLLDLAEGAVDSVWGTLDTLRGLIPVNQPGLAPYFPTPDEAAENWANLGRGLSQSARLFATNRHEFVWTFLDIDGLLDNPERWLGAFVPDLAAAVFSGGAGVAARGARGLDAVSDAAEAARNLDRVAGGGGQGLWTLKNESMSPRAAAYQERITGAPPGQVYRVRDVDFDGFKDGVLQEAKGPGYAPHVENGRFKPYFRGASDLVDQALRQLNAAGGTPIRWSVAEPETATAIRNLFAQEGITDIEVVHVPA